MFCTNCGRKIDKTGLRFCPGCGKPLPVREEKPTSVAKKPAFPYAKYVVQVKAGDSQAFRALYEATYRDMYYLSLKLMKNEAEAEDVLQDAYIRAWNSIGSLSDPDAFRGWLTRIVTNTAKNALVKRSPVLFSQLENENDEGEEYAPDIADDTVASQPELSYTEKETQELVREMIDALSDEQRFCILMFYFENQSIREIAETLGVSENTVKSRLNYGRKNLAKKAEELRKKGCTVFSVTPLPILLRMLRREKSFGHMVQKAKTAMEHSRRSIFSGISASASAAPEAASGSRAAAASEAAGNSAGRAAGTAVQAASPAAAVNTAEKVSFLSTVGGRIAAAAVAVVIAGSAIAGTAAVVSRLSRNSPLPADADTEISETAEETPDTTETAEAPAETKAAAENETPEAGAQTIEAELAAGYQSVVSAMPYDASEYNEDIKKYTSGYYLYDMNGDGIDELLTMHMETSGRYCLYYLDIYTFAYEDGSYTMKHPLTGQSSVGYYLPENGRDLFGENVSGGTGDCEFYRMILDESAASVSIAGSAEKTAQLMSSELEAFITANPAVPWKLLSEPVSDVAELDILAARLTDEVSTDEGGTDGSQEETVSAEEQLAAWQAQAESEGKTLVQGTLRYVSYDELLKIQGKSDPNSGYSDHSRMYTVLIFDSPTVLRCRCGDGSGYREKEAALISLYQYADSQAYDGKHIVAAIDAGTYYWPSDTSLPLGQPSGSEIEIYAVQ